MTTLSFLTIFCMPACGSSNSSQNVNGSGGSVGESGGAPATTAGGSTSVIGTGGATVGTGGALTVPTGGGGGAGGQATGTGGSSGTSGSGGTMPGTGGKAPGSGGAAGMSDAGPADAGGGGCTRDSLKSTVDAYYAALAAHDPSKVALASNVKMTENGMTVTVGQGMWQTAGMVKFKRSALDTVICTSVTESVVPEGTTDRIYGLRLELVGEKVTEIETIVVRDGDYILNNPPGLIASASDDWETPLSADQQPSRDQLQSFMDTYLTKFPAGACNFASDCMRLEDGGSVGACEDGVIVTCNPNATAGASSMQARLHVLDTVAGISVGFTMFAGTYTDFHMFKVRGGMVHGVHACLAQASSSGWD